MAVRVMDYFNANVNCWGATIFVEFVPGEVVNDERLAQELQTLKCPVVPVEDNDTVICPMCRRLCSRKADHRELTIATMSCVVPRDGQTFQFRAGDIVHPLLIEAVRAANIPVVTANGVECPNPKCGHLFY